MIPKKTRLVSYFIGSSLFFMACCIHVEFLNFLNSDIMIGDSGDGYFNLWVLEKTYQRIVALDFQGGLTGHIFWPHDSRTLFWSDNHLIYAPAYAIFRNISSTMIGAFSSLTYFLSMLGYAANFFFYHSVFSIFKQIHPKLSKNFYLFVPIFSYWSHFSETKIRYFMHWQNLSYFWLLFIISGCMNLTYGKLTKNSERRNFCLIAFAQAALFLSTPYFAVLGCILISAWAIPYFCYRHQNFLDLIKRSIFTLIPALTASLAMILIYAANQKQTFAWVYIHSLGAQFHHHFVPRAGLAQVLASYGPWQMPEISHESSAYLGLGVITIILLMASSGIRRLSHDTRLRAVLGKRALVLFAVLLILRLLIEVDRESAAYIITILLVGIGALALFAPQSPKRQGLLGPVLYLLSVFLITNSLAMGPLKSFLNQSVNPSYWWIFRTIVPPLESMRAIGRLAGVGQSVICGLSFFFLLHRLTKSNTNQKKIWLTVFLLLCGMQLADPIGTKALTFKPHLDHLSPSIQAKTFLDQVRSPGVAFPSGPFHANPETMIYFSSAIGVKLMNGYSAHSTQEWDKMMELGHEQNEPTQMQIDWASSLGGEWFMIFKTKLGSNRENELKAQGYSTLYEDERTVFFDIRR